MLIVERADPLAPGPKALLEASHALMREMFEPEENYFLDFEALRGDDVRFFAAREGAFSPTVEPVLPPLGLAALVDWLAARPNDLQAPACRLAPAVAEVLAALDDLSDCLLARMSGSGATCFGLFATAQAARSASVAISVAQPDWWVQATPILDARPH